MFSLRQPSLPPSSPSSSPILRPDSSPPSSPVPHNLHTLSEDEDDAASCNVIVDPLSGSFNAKTRKRSSFAPSLPSTPLKKARLDCARHSSREIPQPFPQSDGTRTTRYSESSLEHREEQIWDIAVERAMEAGSRNIDLTNRSLTRMPSSFVADLEKVVVLRKEDTARRQFGRVQTAPAATAIFSSTSPGLSERSFSANPSLMNGISRNSVQIYLSNNRISSLPVELWGLQSLTVLSLRNNNISYLPPEVSRLRNLQTLNIANNRLKYLPAEMLGMRLQELLLHPNPFLEPPPSNLAKPVSPTIRILESQVPSLTELALRALLSPPPVVTDSRGPLPENISPSVQYPSETLLATLYQLPLPDYFRSGVPYHIQAILEACIPGSIQANQFTPLYPFEESTPVTGIGKCSNPDHNDRVFVRHAEERFTWENVVAARPTGGVVPVRWRGCLHGCLKFLGAEAGSEEEKIHNSLEDAGNEIPAFNVRPMGEGDSDFEELGE